MGKHLKEGYRCKNINPYFSLIPYIMVSRSDSQNHIEISFDITNAERFIKEKRLQGLKGFGLLHIILASYIRTVAERPKINRYIRGQKIYARNEISVSMAVKKEMSLESPDTTVKMHFQPDFNLDDVYNEVNRAVATAVSDTNTDNVARIVNYIPGLLKKFAIWFLKLIDYFGLLPSGIKEASPFHGSMFITNMASLNIPPILHHLYNFGNVPLFISFGAKRTCYDFDENGRPVKKRVVDMVINMDERTCDGYYWASSMKVLKKYLEHPDLLVDKPEKVIKDI